ncbi:hypothetical protein DFH09DRAFT_1099713 [Mycena vulgaris]|nr:hypothetical protein DFH09DRAFT_1099713 [Mycena vulgaris]
MWFRQPQHKLWDKLRGACLLPDKGRVYEAGTQRLIGADFRILMMAKHEESGGNLEVRKMEARTQPRVTITGNCRRDRPSTLGGNLNVDQETRRNMSVQKIIRKLPVSEINLLPPKQVQSKLKHAIRVPWCSLLCAHSLRTPEKRAPAHLRLGSNIIIPFIVSPSDDKLKMVGRGATRCATPACRIIMPVQRPPILSLSEKKVI